MRTSHHSTSSYLDLVSDFATHAAIALVLASGREHARQLTILAERERIAHDLHDHVIQRLFAAGMDVQGTLARARSPEVADRLNRTLDDLQTIIEEIRTTIFQLKSPLGSDSGFRHRIQRVVADLTENRDIVTTVHMHGPMTAVGDRTCRARRSGRRRSSQQRASPLRRIAADRAGQSRRHVHLDIIDNGCWHPRRQSTPQRPSQYEAPR